jgi:hypothetical protein
MGSGLVSVNAGQGLQGSTGPKDIARGVDVGVVTMTARTTSKHSLSDTVCSLDVAAFGTPLTGVAGIYRHHHSTGAFSLVREQ